MGLTAVTHPVLGGEPRLLGAAEERVPREPGTWFSPPNGVLARRLAEETLLSPAFTQQRSSVPALALGRWPR